MNVLFIISALLIGVPFLIILIAFTTKDKRTQKQVDQNNYLSLEESKKQLANINTEISEIKKLNDRIAEQTKIDEASEYAIPMANYLLNELKKYNHILETAKTPEILESVKVNIESHLDWFVEQEETYPNAPWLIVGGAKNMINKVNNRFNMLLYGLAEEEFNSYKIKMSELITEDVKTEHTEIIFSWIDELRGWVDTKAENYEECFNELNKLHYQVEEIFSNSN